MDTPRNTLFQTTRWSVVLRAAGGEPEEAHQALATLCQNYWYPIYSFVRRHGHNHHDAVDLTQSFFAFLIERESLTRADPDRGHFRTFLLASLRNFMNDERKRTNSVKRGGRVNLVSVEAAEYKVKYQRQLTDNCSPEVLFERSWVESLLARVFQQLKLDYQNAGRTELFDALSGYLVADGGRVPQAEIAERLGMSVPAVTMSVQRMRQRFAVVLRQEIAHTVADPAEVDDELKRLKGLMSATM